MLWTVHLDALDGPNYRVRVLRNDGDEAKPVNGPELLRFDWACELSSGPALHRAAKRAATEKLKAAGVPE